VSGVSLTGTLKDGVHRLDIRVYYEDTDHSGRVYHANYLKFCERGRSETLKCAGIEHTALAADDLYFIVRHMDCDFLGAAVIDDIVTVQTRLFEQARAKFVLEQSVLRGGDVLFRARVTLAMVNAQGRPQRIPSGLLERISGA
jgi:acyl-CoA thioester hydrolase